jgi:hypothetical protein
LYRALVKLMQDQKDGRGLKDRRPPKAASRMPTIFGGLFKACSDVTPLLLTSFTSVTSVTSSDNRRTPVSHHLISSQLQQVGSVTIASTAFMQAIYSSSAGPPPGLIFGCQTQLWSPVIITLSYVQCYRTYLYLVIDCDQLRLHRNLHVCGFT